MTTQGVQGGDENSSDLQARRLGEAEAEVFDLKLQLKESFAREARLLETTAELQELLEHSRVMERELRAQVERYAAFHRAVEHSVAWRIVQGLRRLVGRAW